MAHFAFSLLAIIRIMTRIDDCVIVTNIVQISQTGVSITTAAAVRWRCASLSTASASVYAGKVTPVMDLPAKV